MKLLIIQARNFGDAVITTQIINSIGESFTNVEIDILTRPHFKAIFKNNPYVNNIYFANFPMGTNKDFNFKEAKNLIKQIFKLRKVKYDIFINNVGDFREILIGKLVNPKENISFKWEEGHIFHNLIKPGLWSLVDRSIVIPKSIINIYEAQEYFLKKLGCNKLSKPKIYLDIDKKIDKTKVIGIHPLASQKSRLWSNEKWINLVKRILTLYDYEIWIFGAPSEKQQLHDIFGELLKETRVKLKCNDLEQFFKNLSFIEILIGLDSFSIHAAYAVGTKSIMLNGSNDYKIWKPPNARVVSKGNLCSFYPCYNKPKCIGKNFEYICMKSIEIDDVFGILKEEISTYRR